MNAIAYIVLLSSSINSLKGIRRIPISSYLRTHSDEINNSEYHQESEDDNPQIERQLSPVNINETNNVDIVSTTTENNREVKFTDFIVEAAKIIQTYENSVLEQAFQVIDDEVWKDVYKGCKSHELADIKKYASDQLSILKDTPANKLRQHLKHIVELFNTDDYGELNELVTYVNSLYIGESEKFIEYLLALVHRRMTDEVDLANILKDALKSLVFDHYCNLSDFSRRELIKMYKHYWRQFISQVINDKGVSNTEVVPFVTPFIYEKRIKKLKKRRFNKVNAARSLVSRWDENSESLENEDIETGIEELDNENDAKMRVDSPERSHEHLKSSESEGIKDITSKNSFGRTIFVTQSKTMNTFVDKNNTSRQRSSRSTPIVLSMLRNRSSKYKPSNDLQQSNNTIEKLIDIGTLAKEINDLARPEDKILRNGEYVVNWDSLLGIDLGFSMNNLMGNAPSTTETVNANGDDDKKNVVISMKANYKE